ncbi:MAG: MFS transporter [Firmicutes bacterium]|nr:MFS transporter [Bacillota bacterium]
MSGAFLFITLMGIVSLFSDMTHEGARSILGEFLNLTGATAATIGFVSGLGELLGYGLRIVSGRLADKSKHYWTFIIVGYAIQVLAIPALALTGENGWIFACSMVILERVGKAVKKPAKNTLVSFASSEIGVGKGFAYQEFLDQLGAFLGPVMLFFIGMIKGSGDLFSTYRLSFAFLGIPAAITIALVLLAKVKYPDPEVFAKKEEKTEKFVTGKPFVFYTIAISLFAFGFIDFTIITLHASKSQLFSGETLSLLYALAMIVDAFAALLFGWLYDKIGLKSLMISSFLSAFFSVFVFVSGTQMAMILGIVLWGVGMGAQESVMKAAVSGFVPKRLRSTGFGIFETAFGISWFFGSWLLGYLYDYNLYLMVVLSVLFQLVAIVFYILSQRGAAKYQNE